jgi:hypothetical protein
VAANEPWDAHILAMQDMERFSETVSERNRRREAEIAEALQGEARRHDAAIKNMHRLRALRLERGQTAPNGPSPINEPPPPIDDPPKPPRPDEPPKPPPVNDPPPEEKPPPMRAASGSAGH